MTQSIEYLVALLFMKIFHMKSAQIRFSIWTCVTKNHYHVDILMIFPFECMLRFFFWRSLLLRNIILVDYFVTVARTFSLSPHISNIIDLHFKLASFLFVTVSPGYAVFCAYFLSLLYNVPLECTRMRERKWGRKCEREAQMLLDIFKTKNDCLSLFLLRLEVEQ